jgi:single-stranded-DNA-specific exonuclease
MQKKWIFKDYDPAQASRIAKELNIPEVLGILLSQRNIITFKEAKDFFRPDLNHLHDPFLMKGMHEAVERVNKALSKKEKILVYGDYDVDGTCSVAMVYQFLSRLTSDVAYYIPDRYAEGYGLSDAGVDHAISNNYSLVITLDCGIKSVAKIKRAQEAGVDFIVCDHHTPGDELPPAIAVLDPKQKDCGYPYKELCGCGVGFKLLQALSSERALDESELYAYLDLVSLAIAADIVPIDGENRILCYHGLKVINDNPRLGIAIMLPFQEKKNEVRISDLVFKLAPRINAAGRIRSGKFAVQLLIEEIEEEARRVFEEIENDNKQRKELDRDITQEALSYIQNDPGAEANKSTVVYNEQWHKGVVGIVASRLIENYFRPTVVLTRSGDIATGSARSVPGFDLYQALEACSEHLIQFGGHKYAAGMTLEIDRIASFKSAFEEVVRSSIAASQLVPVINVDLELSFSDLNAKLYRIIQQMEPFGPGNREPVLFSKNVFDTGYSRTVGEDATHLKLHIKQEGSEAIDAIAFNFGHLYEDIRSRRPFDIVYYLQENVWNGKAKLQLMIKDIHLH